MHDADKVTIFNRTAPGSTPHEPLALVAKISDSERSTLESEERGELASAAEPDTTHREIRYCTSIQHSSAFLFITSRLLGEVYYLLYADDCEIPSKVAFDPEMPSLGRIRADFVAPPHTPTSIKRYVSRVESTSFDHADLFADILCDAPLKGPISTLHTDASGPGMSPNEPMAIVQMPMDDVIVQPFPDGKYAIKNRAADIYWNAGNSPIRTVLFRPDTTGRGNFTQVNEHSSILQVFKR